LRNPLTGGTSWDVSSKEVVKSILPGGSKHEVFKSYLDKLATFLLALKTDDGTYVPVLFRPFHEHTGSWFWWGKDLCSVEDYKSLWKFTVSYLQNEKNIHHLIYTYSTDRFKTTEEYLERYPGDDWVDIMGCENYWDFQSGATISNGIAQLRMLVNLAMSRKKLAALTETGFDGIPVKNWWTQYLLTPIKADSVARNISYLMVWRNANRKHYYVPFKDHKSAMDFIQFEQDTFTIFGKDLEEGVIW